LRLTVTSTADDLSGATIIDNHERPRNPKTAGFGEFFAILGCELCEAHLNSEFSPKITGDRPKQPVYVIKLMMSRVS